MTIKNLRWWVIALIALATIINYIDRQSLNVLWPEIAADLYPNKTDDERKEIYAFISVVFVFSYAFGQAIFGKVFDWVGTRIGFALSIGIWSIATALHAFAKGIVSFSIFRAILGVAEAGNWPGAAKGNAEWFPIKERALAQGIFNSGAAIGGIISIPLIAFLSIYFSWKAIFVIIASAAIDPIWWLFVFWIPIYLSEVYGMDVKTIGIYGWVPYVGAMFGAWFGGLLAQNRIKSGWSVDATRKLTITLGCLIMLPTLLAMSDPGSPVNAVLLMAIILFGFQTAIGNVQTLPSDLFGGKTVGTLAGMAGMAAKLGAVALTSLVPWLTSGGNYTPAFVIGAALAVIAVVSIWVLCPNIEPLKPKQ